MLSIYTLNYQHDRSISTVQAQHNISNVNDAENIILLKHHLRTMPWKLFGGPIGSDDAYRKMKWLWREAQQDITRGIFKNHKNKHRNVCKRIHQEQRDEGKIKPVMNSTNDKQNMYYKQNNQGIKKPMMNGANDKLKLHYEKKTTTATNR